MPSWKYKRSPIQIIAWPLKVVAVWKKLPIFAVRILGVWVFVHLILALPLLLHLPRLADWNLLNFCFSLEILFIAGWSAAFTFGQLWGIALFYASFPLCNVVTESWILGWQAPFYKIVNGRLHSDPAGMIVANVCMAVLVGFSHNMARRHPIKVSRAHDGHPDQANRENTAGQSLEPFSQPASGWRSTFRVRIWESFHWRGKRVPAFYGAGFQRIVYWIPRFIGAALLLSAAWNLQSVHQLWQNVGSSSVAAYRFFALWQVVGWLLSIIAAVSLLLAPAWGYCVYAAMGTVFAFSGQIAPPFGWTINKHILEITRPDKFNTYLTAALLNAAILCFCGILQSLTVRNAINLSSGVACPRRSPRVQSSPQAQTSDGT